MTCHKDDVMLPFGVIREGSDRDTKNKGNVNSKKANNQTAPQLLDDLEDPHPWIVAFAVVGVKGRCLGPRSTETLIKSQLACKQHNVTVEC